MAKIHWVSLGKNITTRVPHLILIPTTRLTRFSVLFRHAIQIPNSFIATLTHSDLTHHNNGHTLRFPHPRPSPLRHLLPRRRPPHLPQPPTLLRPQDPTRRRHALRHGPRSQSCITRRARRLRGSGYRSRWSVFIFFLLLFCLNINFILKIIYLCSLKLYSFLIATNCICM